MRELLQIYGAHPASLLVFLVGTAIAGFLLLIFVTFILSFIGNQVFAIFSLYRNRVEEAELDYHPYTLSILNNECPEISELSRLQSLPRTRAVRGEIERIVQSMISTLEESEPLPIKGEIIAALKQIA